MFEPCKHATDVIQQQHAAAGIDVLADLEMQFLHLPAQQPIDSVVGGRQPGDGATQQLFKLEKVAIFLLRSLKTRQVLFVPFRWVFRAILNTLSRINYMSVAAFRHEVTLNVRKFAQIGRVLHRSLW